MGWFSREDPGRSASLERAARARSRGRAAKAIAEYQQALAERPDDPMVHGKLAPLFVQEERFEEAWRAFLAAGEGYRSQGFVQKTVAIYAQAASLMPWHPQAWKALAGAQFERGQRADALKAYLDGRARMRRPAQRPEAIDLVEHALRLDPESFPLSLDMARLLRLVGRGPEAGVLLGRLEAGRRGRELRQVRGQQLRLAFGPGSLGRWLRALVVGR